MKLLFMLQIEVYQITFIRNVQKVFITSGQIAPENTEE
jgi:hypothetical protein